jgi:hypothetical protein
MKKDLKQVFWIETILCGLTSASAFAGYWGAFAGMAFLCSVVPIWIIAAGVWANVFGPEVLKAVAEDGERAEADQ